MMSLFSSFDMSNYFFLFLPFVLSLFHLNFSFYKISNFKVAMQGMTNELLEFFSSLKVLMFNKIFYLVFVSVFLVFFLINIFSMFPYTPSLTSQISVVASLSLTMWVSFYTWFLYNFFKSYIAHCVPEGTPIYLTWFLFMIENVSNIIRPLTVTVRLVANILAGHLLMILLSKLVFFHSFLILLYMFLNLAEMFVALIQAYIFVTMFSLFYSELH